MVEAEIFDVVIIGAGPGGYVAAIRAAQLGMTVACVEKDSVGGTCLNVGCIPSKALLESSELYYLAKETFKDHGIEIKGLSLDFKTVIARKDTVVRQLTGGVAGLFKKNKVTHVKGTARLLGSQSVEVTGKEGTRLLKAKAIVIATGSAPISLPILPLDGERVVDSTGALSLSAIPKELVVIGGGYIGLEMGSVYLRLGSKVTVVEATDRIAGTLDAEVATVLHRALKKQGMDFRLSTKLVSGTTKKKQVELSLDSGGTVSTLVADCVLVAVGRRPYLDGLGVDALGIQKDERGRLVVDAGYQTTVAGVYAIGDVIAGPMLAHKASEEGVALVEILAGQKGHVNYATIPSVVYTAPEVASVGLSEAEATAQGIDYTVAKFPYAANGRALALGEKEGFVKLMANRVTDRLIGAHLIGPRASELIGEIVLGMEFGTSAEDIARTVHAHPTLSEATKEAALALGSGAIHM